MSDGTRVGPDPDPVDLDSMEPLTHSKGIPADGTCFHVWCKRGPITAAGQRRDFTDFPFARAIFSWLPGCPAQGNLAERTRHRVAPLSCRPGSEFRRRGKWYATGVEDVVRDAYSNRW